MRSGTHQIKIFHTFRLVVKAEPGRLAEQGRNRKTRPEHAAIIIFEVRRRHEKVGHNGLFEPRQNGSAERRDNLVLQLLALLLPVNVSLQIRHGAQHIKGITAWWCKTRVRRGRAMEIERNIIVQYFSMENIRQQLLITVTHDDRMMRDIVIGPLRAEI